MQSYTLANGKTRHFTAPLNVVTINYATQPQRLSEVSLAGMRQLEVDAVVIQNFLQPSEIETLLQNLLRQPANAVPLTQSKTYPFSFALLNRQSPAFEAELQHYFEQCRQFRNSFAQTYGLDMEQRFTQVLTALNNNHPARVLNLDAEHCYIPFTFRLIVPEKNHINLHADNMFAHFAPEFYAPLKQVAEVHNQLSFFTVLQKPHTGGELSLYNVAWDVAKEFNIEEQSVILHNGTHLHAQQPQELYRQQFNLQPGDLVLFAGGQLYHRIEETYGQQMRITLGGFIGYSKNNDDIYYWS